MLIKKLRAVFRQPEFSVLLFFFSLFLFVIPFQRPADKGALEVTFFCLFLLWFIVIFLIYFMSREIPTASDKEQEDG